MADIRGIELASEIYDLEDTSARNTATAASQTATQAGQTATQASQTATQASQTATQASQTATQADSKIGNLANLETTAKTNLVAAINENAQGIKSLKQKVFVMTFVNEPGDEDDIQFSHMKSVLGHSPYELTANQYIICEIQSGAARQTVVFTGGTTPTYEIFGGVQSAEIGVYWNANGYVSVTHNSTPPDIKNAFIAYFYDNN